MLNNVTDLHVHSSVGDRQSSGTMDCAGTSREQRTTSASPSVADEEL